MNVESHGADKRHADNEGWSVSLVGGSLSSSKWPLGREPLLVGRGLGCHVCIDDTRVSRFQCEILISGGAPTVRNQSRSNPTLLNGSPITDSPLRVGDKIEFAQYRLIVESWNEAGVIDAPSTTSPETTRRISDSQFLVNDSDIPGSDNSTVHAAYIATLFGFQRAITRIESLEKLIVQTKTHIAEQLGPCECWFALCVCSDGELTLFPSAANAMRAKAPLSVLKRAIELRTGIITTVKRESDSLAVPLMHSGSVIGGITIRREAAAVPYSTMQLDYLLAISDCVSPLILARERIEQLERDRLFSDRARGATGAMVGNSKVMTNLREAIRRVAPARGSVLLRGETGVGKELVARAIHDAGPRSSGPYIVANCPTIPDSLFESEMFGYEPGAFTGASEARPGLFEQAHGGTLFLDEIGDLSPTNQARLLRVSETNSFRRLGSTEERVADVRIISATNRDVLRPENNEFRDDLAFRLANIILWIPPLRERREDIPELASYFMSIYSPHSNAHPARIEADAMDRLVSHSWPGNIRELRNIIEQGCYTTTGDTIRSIDLVVHREEQNARDNVNSLVDVERNHLIGVLKTHKGNVADSAAHLGIAASTLYYKLKKHKIRLRDAQTLQA